MRERNGWWVSLISLGMIGYGGASLFRLWQMVHEFGCGCGCGCGTTAFQHGINQNNVPSAATSAILPLLIAVVGVFGLLSQLMRQPEDFAPRSQGPVLQPYVLAWQKLWRTKWLLWIYGSAALISILSDLFGVANAVSFYRLKHPVPDLGVPSSVSLSQRLTTALWTQLPSWSSFVYDKFVPRATRISGPIVVLLVVFLALWVLSRVRRSATTPELRRKAPFFAVCMFLLIAACTYALVTGVPWEFKVFAMQTAPATDAATGGQRMVPPNRVCDSGITLLVDALVCAVLVGGILGSLLRSKRGEVYVRSSFVGDAIRYFEPLAAIYLLLWALIRGQSFLMLLFRAPVVNWLFLGLLSFGLMYAPAAIVSRSLGFGAAVADSLRVWKRAAWRTLSLLATGVFMFGLVEGLLRFVELQLPRISWAGIIVPSILAAVGVVLNAVALLAVWEFYQAEVEQIEPASLVEA